MEPMPRRADRRPDRDERLVRPRCARRDRGSPARGALGDLAASAAARARLRALLLGRHGARARQGLRPRRVPLAALALQPVVRGHEELDARPEALAVRARRPAAAAASLLPHRAERPRARAATVASFSLATPLVARVHGHVGDRRGCRLRRRRRATACSRCGRGEGRSRRDELDEQARVRPLRPQRRRPARRARHGLDGTRCSSTRRRRERPSCPPRQSCAPCGSAGLRRRRRPPSPTGRSPTCSGSRAPRHARTSTSCSSRPSTRGFPSSGTPTVVGVHDLIAEELPGADVSVARGARPLAPQALERDADARAACSPSPRRRAR